MENPFDPNYSAPEPTTLMEMLAANPALAGEGNAKTSEPPVVAGSALINAPGIYPDITPDQYFAEPCPEPALSNSGISKLLNETPEEFAFEHPAIGAPREAVLEKIAKRRGDVLHQLVLGKGRGYRVTDIKVWNRKHAGVADFLDGCAADGVTPIKRDDFEAAEKMAAVVRERIKRALDGADYQTEVIIACQVNTDHGMIWVRGMIDVWCEERLTIIDPKVTPLLNKAEQHMVNMGWDRQAALYPFILGRIHPAWAGRIRFGDLMVKPTAPHTSRLIWMREGWKHSSLVECDRAMNLFAQCKAAGEWPGYPPEGEILDAPDWVTRRRIEQAAYEGAN